MFHRECWDSLCEKVQSSPQGNPDVAPWRDAASAAEKFDSADELAKKATEAAAILRQCKRVVCFTGAGISTAAGLGDYRGKEGKWTRESWGNEAGYTTEYEALRPTHAHECVAKLVGDGVVGYVASQNADGLHHLSGISYDKLSDVHGSAFTEYCTGCGKRYVREVYAPEDRAESFFAGKDPGPLPHVKKCHGCGSNHMTGRNCDDCGNALRDTIISFGDGLERCVLDPAFEFAQSADACLSLGSTMSIGPSNQIAIMHQGPLIACVRQDTEMDSYVKRSGGVRVYGDCDDFMRLLMREYYGEEAVRTWEQSLSSKIELYNKLRPSPGKQRGDVFVKKF